MVQIFKKYVIDFIYSVKDLGNGTQKSYDTSGIEIKDK